MVNRYSEEVLYWVSRFPAFASIIFSLADSNGGVTESLEAFIAYLEEEGFIKFLKGDKTIALEKECIERLIIENSEAIQNLIAENVKLMQALAEMVTEKAQNHMTMGQ